jgi:hypothetical protein
MVHSLNLCLATVLALTLAAPGAMAQTAPHRHVRHVVHHRAVAIPPGDIVVHARSYLDPGPPAWNEVGTGDRYASDSTPSSPLAYRELGSEFGLGGFETLPTRFNPPGRPQPIWEFSEP